MTVFQTARISVGFKKYTDKNAPPPQSQVYTVGGLVLIKRSPSGPGELTLIVEPSVDSFDAVAKTNTPVVKARDFLVARGGTHISLTKENPQVQVEFDGKRYDITLLRYDPGPEEWEISVAEV